MDHYTQEWWEVTEKTATTRFGEIEAPPENTFCFPEGLPGFPDCRRFVLLQSEEHAPFVWMQSLDEPDLCFVTADPLAFFPDYRIESTRTELAGIQLTEVEQARVLVILVVPGDLAETTANLQGPLIFNMEKQLARQLVLVGDHYSTKHRLFEPLPTEAPSPPEG